MSENRNYSDVAAVIATLNEQEGVGPTLTELKTLDGINLIVVDGNSLDNTAKIAKDQGAEVLLQQAKGKGDAMLQGTKQLAQDVRYVVFTDADYTYPAKYIPKMIDILEHEAKVGMVIGNRFNGEHNFSKSTTNMFYRGNRLLAFAQYVLNDVKLNDPLSGLRVVRRELLDNWKPESKSFDIEAELNHYVERKGFRTVEVSIQYRQRLGEKKLKLRHGFAILKRIITESFRPSEGTQN